MEAPKLTPLQEADPYRLAAQALRDVVDGLVRRRALHGWDAQQIEAAVLGVEAAVVARSGWLREADVENTAIREALHAAGGRLRMLEAALLEAGQCAECKGACGHRHTDRDGEAWFEPCDACTASGVRPELSPETQALVAQIKEAADA